MFKYILGAWGSDARGVGFYYPHTSVRDPTVLYTPGQGGRVAMAT